MRKKRTYIILLIILVAYFLLLYLFIGKDNLKKESFSTTIMVGDNTVWALSGKRWLNITKQSSIDSLNWQKFTVFVDNENLGKNYVWHDDKWYIFDKNKNAVVKTGKFLAYRANYKINVLNYEEENITDLTYVNKVLEENNLSSPFTASSKTTLDIDNDNIKEDFYIISNAFADEFVPDTLFSIVFMVKNGKIYYIYKDISTNDLDYKECKPYFNYFLDIDDDKTYEMILSCGRYSIKEEINMLYSYTKDGFKIIISNQ